MTSQTLTTKNFSGSISLSEEIPASAGHVQRSRINRSNPICPDTSLPWQRDFAHGGWVVRENVCSPDVGNFAAGLGLQGYGVVIVELDSRHFTAQSRSRQFVIGGAGYTSAGLGKAFCDRSSNCGRTEQVRQGGSEAVALCLTTHPCGFYSSDNTIYERGKGLRYLCSEERETLQGFPIGWTKGFSYTRRVKMLGNTMTVPVVEWIGRTIVLMDKQQTE